VAKAGEIIRRVRKNRKLPRIVFAQQLGISTATLDRIENDNPSVDVDSVGLAASKLGLTMNYHDRTITPPPGLPPPAPPRRGMAGKRVLPMPPELYRDLEAIAKQEGQNIIDYLFAHVRACRSIIRQPARREGRAKEASRASRS
jgi:transcriptional regulator with XRE-family HTH domain